LSPVSVKKRIHRNLDVCYLAKFQIVYLLGPDRL
jgi:hypothetical protein